VESTLRAAITLSFAAFAVASACGASGGAAATGRAGGGGSGGVGQCLQAGATCPAYYVDNGDGTSSAATPNCCNGGIQSCIVCARLGADFSGICLDPPYCCPDGQLCHDDATCCSGSCVGLTSEPIGGPLGTCAASADAGADG
jgi:hypothetical protein